jgi:hypothetical protein
MRRGMEHARDQEGVPPDVPGLHRFRLSKEIGKP